MHSFAAMGARASQAAPDAHPAAVHHQGARLLHVHAAHRVQRPTPGSLLKLHGTRNGPPDHRSESLFPSAAKPSSAPRKRCPAQGARAGFEPEPAGNSEADCNGTCKAPSSPGSRLTKPGVEGKAQRRGVHCASAHGPGWSPRGRTAVTRWSILDSKKTV